MLDYTAEQIATAPFVELIAEEDRALVLDRYVRRLRGEDVPHQYQFRFKTRTGGLFWIEINSVMIDWNGRPATLCFFRDINDQKRAEAALLESEAQYHSLVESLPLAIFGKDAEGRIIFANSRFCDSIGRPLAELRGKTDFDFFPVELAEKYRADDYQVLSTGKALEVIEEYRKADGEMIYVQVLKAPIFGASGEVRGVQGMWWDVSARHTAEEQLRRSAERTRLILDTAYDAFVAIDAAGLIVEWNPQAVATFGWSREEALGQPAKDLILPKQLREAYTRRFRQFMESGRGNLFNNRIEATVVRKDGTEFPVEIAIAPMPLGETYMFHAFLHDISRRKRYEAELRDAKEAAEAASRAKSAFLANMSHEIRTPMNAVIGMAELVLDTSLDAEQREYIKLVLESADSLLSIINDLLDFSKIEAGKFDLDPVPFDLRESVGDTMKSLAVRAHKKGLELIHDISADVPPCVVGDPNRLRQVILNLVGNAIKFTDHGEVVLKISPEAPGSNGQSGKAVAAGQPPSSLILHFAVQDTGIGVPPDKRELIFRAFEQADSSTTRRFGGTGLGLAISSALVELLGGRVWLESDLGRGSVFHFTARFDLADPGVLPDSRRLREAPIGSALSAAPATLDGLRVLIVDDNETNRRIQVEMLRNWRMAPVAVPGAVAALAALLAAQRAGQPFQVVLTDANMPDVDGFVLVRQIRDEPKLHGAVIMMLTSGDRPDDISQCRELGVSVYLMKPVKQSELFDAIASAVGLATLDATAQPTQIADIANRTGALRILLAEDSLVNQKLAIGLLSRQGHQVFVANNGREALAAAETHQFDLVLMDVQMPELDGLDATRAIRIREQAARCERVKIVAMTAHAMTGDRDRCLAAGMDGYISKPIRAADLFATIDQVMADGPAIPRQETTAAAVATETVDWSVAWASVGEDPLLLGEIIAAFRAEAPLLLSDLRQAGLSGDQESLRRAAHTLKGTLRYFGAESVAELAFGVETLSRDGHLPEAIAAAETLDSRVRGLLPALAQIPQEFTVAPG
jgi:two-component system sensor histidine kinase/response regulator